MQKTAHVLVGAHLVDGIGLGLLLPVLPFFLQEFGASAVGVTHLVALYALVTLIFSPLLGRLSDHVGRKVLVLLCSFTAAFVYLSYLTVQSLVWVFAVRAVHGLVSARGGVVNAWIIDLVEHHERTRYLGLLASMGSVGMLIGPVIASFLIAGTGDNYQSVFLAGATLSLLAFICVLFIQPAPVAAAALPPPNPTTNKVHWDLLSANFTVFLGFSVIFATSAIYMEARFGWGGREVGLAIALMTGCVAFARAMVAHRLFQFLGVQAGTALSGAVIAICLVLCTVLLSPVWFLAFYCLSACGYAVAAIGMTVLMSERVSAENRGAGMGQLGAAASLAIVFGATTHGYLFESISPAAPYEIYGLLVALLMFGWYGFSEKLKRR